MSTSASNMYVDDVTKATFNGRQVKIFTVWENRNGVNFHVGKFTAPARTANSKLLAVAIEKMDAFDESEEF